MKECDGAFTPSPVDKDDDTGEAVAVMGSLGGGNEKNSPRPGDSLVRYRLREPNHFTPPAYHEKVGDREYVAQYEPRLEFLDEIGVIDVVDWGGT